MPRKIAELRKKFAGQPEHVINFFFFVAEQVRQYMADLGFKKVDDMVGRVEMLDVQPAVDHWKAKGVDLSAILYNPPLPGRVARHCVQAQDHGLDAALDHQLIAGAKAALENRTPVEMSFPIRNVHRTVGAMLSGQIARRYGSEGLPDDTIRIKFDGSAGQSFGAFLAKGVTMTLEGDANDYVGKGLSGGRVIVYPPKNSRFAGGRKYCGRQRRALRRDQRRGIFQRRGRRTVCGAELGSDRGGGRRRRPRLRIHDQRAGGGARLLRQKFRRRNERRHRLCVRRQNGLHREALQSGVGRSGAGD